MKIPDKLKGITGDLMYSIAGLIVMNGVIQFLLYPYLTKQLGAESFGEVLTMISLVAIMGSTFGTAANYSRMVASTKGEDTNGDYNIFMAMIAFLSIFVTLGGMLWLGSINAVFFVGYFVLMVATVLRYYSDVEFRLHVNYKHFFFYYLIISIGYCLGIVTYQFTKSWIIVMLLGEAFAVLYVIITGHIFRSPLFKPSKFFKSNLKSFALLSGTELIATLVLNADRIMLQVIAGGVAVTVFYAATLVGKMASLISMPLNGVVIGHLSRYEGKLKPSMFNKICLGSIVLGLVMNVFCVGVSYVFVKIMYAEIFDMTAPYFWIANLGQIFYFVSNTLTVILLRFTAEKYQLYINIIYLIAFLVIAIPMTFIWQLWGMAWALVIVNLFKIMVIMAIGTVQLRKVS